MWKLGMTLKLKYPCIQRALTFVCTTQRVIKRVPQLNFQNCRLNGKNYI